MMQNVPLRRPVGGAGEAAVGEAAGREAVVREGAAAEVAAVLVAAGRVVPGLTVEPDGSARSWWWPLPAASHRPMIAALVDDSTPAGQRAAADRLAEAVDGLVRARLVEAGAVIAPPR